MIAHTAACSDQDVRTLYVRRSRAEGQRYVPVGSRCETCGAFELVTVAHSTASPVKPQFPLGRPAHPRARGRRADDRYSLMNLIKSR